MKEAISTGSENSSVIAAIRLLIFTGCRKSEILKLRWEHVDLKSHLLRLPDSKTGAKSIYLNDPALSVLQNLDPKRKGWVIKGAKPESHLINLKKPWGRIRQAAALDDVRIHDLRHCFASIGVQHGESLVMVGKLLGHTQPRTTAQYAHLSDAPLKGANERIGQIIEKFMGGEI